MITAYLSFVVFVFGFVAGFGIANLLTKPKAQFRKEPPEGVHGVCENIEEWN